MNKNLKNDFPVIESLEKLIKYALVSGFAFLTGYPTSRLLFGESRWRETPRLEKGIYSALSGGAVAVIICVLIFVIEFLNPECRLLLEGQEISLTLVLLLIVAWIEVICIAILQRKRKKIVFYVEY